MWRFAWAYSMLTDSSLEAGWGDAFWYLSGVNLEFPYFCILGKPPKCNFIEERLETHQAPNSPPVVLSGVISTRVDIRSIQIQVVSAAVAIRGRRPIAAVTATIVNRTAADVAGIEEVNWILAPS